MVSDLLKQIKLDTPIWTSEIHGVSHWRRVEQNGLMLAEAIGADAMVVSYFAFLHDCQRWNEFDDPEHGPRAASYAKTHRGLIDLNDEQFRLLQRACSGHTHAHPLSSNPVDLTLGACWDADRLDLGRVGIVVDPEYLFTDFAKSLVKEPARRG